MNADGKILAISGGVGGAKLALGLSKTLPPQDLSVVCNTGDDFNHLGLRICPDIDTVLYTLSGQSNQELGWGLENESWQVMERLKELGGETWFNLGDRDLATHLLRTHLLSQGENLATVTAQLAEKLGVLQQILPMSNDQVATLVNTPEGTMTFQRYFVGEQCRPKVSGFEFSGKNQARPHPEFMTLLASADLAAVIICPSNPFLSIDPILHLPGVREALKACPAPVIAVSPIVGGRAIKGPTAKIMAELDKECSCVAVAKYYGDFIDGYVLDTIDQEHEPAIAALGLNTAVTNTVMKNLHDKEHLALRCLALAKTIKQ